MVSGRRAVWKFELLPKFPIDISMPSGAQILRTGFQGDSLFMWALVDTYAPLVVRSFCVFGTGHHIDDSEVGLKFVGGATVGALEFHVFERNVL